MSRNRQRKYPQVHSIKLSHTEEQRKYLRMENRAQRAEDLVELLEDRISALKATKVGVYIWIFVVGFILGALLGTVIG